MIPIHDATLALPQSKMTMKHKYFEQIQEEDQHNSETKDRKRISESFFRN